jgi:60 kDa SS-A/Ro ribonucleoprotein
MANKTLFRSLVGALIPKADAINEAGGPAYSLSPEQALAQFASTGCLNTTFYATDAEQLDRVTTLAERVSPQFVAKTAVYCRERGFMKDMPALLLAVLSRRAPVLMDRVFERVVDSPRMLRTFVQIVRSGATGRKSLGSAPKRCVRRWLDQRTDAAIFAASVGNQPSIVDVVRMVHPKPATPVREALYGYLLGRTIATESLPSIVRAFEAFKAGDRASVPDVPFQMLTSLDLDTNAWCEIARRASWQATRMNLNAFARHGVFATRELVDLIAARLRDESELRRARVFPYQLLAAFRSVDDAVPNAIRRALEDAMESAIANVPAIDGQVYVCPDVSGSMQSPVTGVRKGSTTAMRCVDVAALVSAAVLRRNPTADVLPFEESVVSLQLSPRDSVMTNAERLASVGGGGTCVSAPLTLLNERKAAGDLVIVVSDNQSWVDASGSRGTATMREWNAFRARNPQARLALIDLQPYQTTQASERSDILNVGGFSDQVFSVLADFASGSCTPIAGSVRSKRSQCDQQGWTGMPAGLHLPMYGLAYRLSGPAEGPAALTSGECPAGVHGYLGSIPGSGSSVAWTLSPLFVTA